MPPKGIKSFPLLAKIFSKVQIKILFVTIVYATPIMRKFNQKSHAVMKLYLYEL